MRTRLPCIILVLAILPIALAAQTGGPVLLKGTEVQPLGAATVAITPGPVSGAWTSARSHHELVISNIGDTGFDGARFVTGGSQGGLLAFSATPTPLPVSGRFVWEVKIAGGILPCVRVEHFAAGDIQLIADFSPVGSPTHRAEVWDDGAFVAGFTGMTTNLSTTQLPTGFGADVELLPATGISPPYEPDGALLVFWSGNVILTDPSTGQNATGDELRLFPESATAPMTSVSSMDLLVTVPAASAPYSMECDDVAQLMFGRMHRGTDGARILSHAGAPPTFASASAFADHLDISLFVDPLLLAGIRLDVDPAESEDCVIWDIMDSGGNGASDEFSVVAELTAGGQAEVGRVTSLHDGTNWSVTPDFSGSGSSDYDVELFDAGGTLVAQASSVTGAITVATPDWVSETGVENDGLAMILGYPTPAVITLPGAGAVTAQRIKVHSNAVAHSYFANIGRSVFSNSGGQFDIVGEPNSMVLPSANGVNQEFVGTPGPSYLRKCSDCIVINNIGSSGDDGVDVSNHELGHALGNSTCFFDPGTPSQNTGETDWAFVTRLAGLASPVKQMSVNMNSDGVMVDLTVDPEQSTTTEYMVVLRKAGVIQAQFAHTSLSTPFAQLPHWPIGVGGHMLAYPDQPWKMWINLGQEMDVTIPGGPTTTSSNTPLTKADLIEVLADKTSLPASDVERTGLWARFKAMHRFLINRNPPPGSGGTGIIPDAGMLTVLHAPYPNPFNPSTTLSFELSQSGRVTLRVYSVDGRYVATVHNGPLGAGPHSFEWNGTNHRGQQVASGVYLVNLDAPDGTLRAKVNLLK